MTLAEKYAQGIYEARKRTQLSDHAFYIAVELAIKKRHHEKLLPQIFHEYSKLASRKKATHVTVRVASADDEQKALAKARELSGENPTLVRDASLIRGYSVEGRDFRYDASARQALINLYARLTA